MPEGKSSAEQPKFVPPKMQEQRPVASPGEKKPLVPEEVFKSERSARVEGKIEHIVNATQDYISDMKTAYDKASELLYGQTVTGKVLEGLTVTGIGAGLESIANKSANWILGEFGNFFVKLRPDQIATGVNISRDKDRSVGLSPKDFLGKKESEIATMLKQLNQSHEEVLEYKTQVNDAGLPVVPVDVRKALQEQIMDKFMPKGDGGVRKESLFGKFMTRALMQGFDDTMVAGAYGFINRITWHMLPEVPAEYLGRAYLAEIGIAAGSTLGEAAGQKLEAKGWNLKGKPKNIAEKGTQFVAGALKLVNPVSLYGLDLVKNGLDAYKTAFDYVREERKMNESGNKKWMYVAEGKPQYQQQRGWQGRNRPWQRGGRRYG